jgi:hypothetical protein
MSDAPTDGPAFNYVIFVGNDLMFQSRIGAVAKNAGLKLIAIRDPHQLSEKLAELIETQSIIRYVVVDLGMPTIDLPQLAKTTLNLAPSTHLLGYGAHVLKDTLELASNSGFHSVFTRGQFDRDMTNILA